MSQKKMALKPYLEAIEKYCTQLSDNELTNVIISLAKEISVRERQGFLDKLHSFSPAEKAMPDEESIRDTLSDQIEALKEDIQERIDSIEDGSYWDTIDYDDGYYDDEEPDYISEEQLAELTDFFGEAEQYFLDDQLELARDIYRRLFDLMGESDELEYSISGSSDTFDLKETRARYCRCVYETAKKEDRIKEVLEAIHVYASVSDSVLMLEKERRPMLQDVIDSKTGDMQNWDDFLNKWAAALKKIKTDRAAVLLAEATFFIKGDEGVADLARKWGKAQPRGYLYRIQNRIKEKDWKAVAEACQEALKILPDNSFREQAAGYLALTGRNLTDKTFILQGKREKFISSPGVTNLLDLADEAGKQDVRAAELENLLNIFKKPGNSALTQKPLYTKFLLMTGDVKAAFNNAQKEKNVGWSYGKAGLVFGSTLYMVCDKSDKAETVKGLLKKYAGTRSGYSWSGTHDANPAMYDEILKGINQCDVSSADKTAFWDWAYKIGCGRIDHIVSNKYRKAYLRAATVLGALSECHILFDQKSKAQSLVDTFYFNKYKRFSAFKREVKSVFKSSGILRAIRL
ncbi:hypothetical protein QUF90_11120 [Desulfococcaceae bacterium HSG9]|nr:hypothetical protein [Desulfococcaceae bacterium HSG9]